MGVHSPLQPAYALANRAAIENEIERLIALLDAHDGDCDAEEDDWPGDPLDRGEQEEGQYVPRYGEDQTVGPINQREMWRLDHLRKMGAVQ